MRTSLSLASLFALVIFCGCATAGGLDAALQDPGLAGLRHHLDEKAFVTGCQTQKLPGGWLKIIDVSVTTGWVDAMPVMVHKKYVVWPLAVSAQARQAIAQRPELRGLSASRYAEDGRFAILVVECGLRDGLLQAAASAPEYEAVPLETEGE